MINRGKLKVQTGSAEEGARLARIAEIVSTSIRRPMDLVTGVALIDILANRKITLSDGTIWNNPLDPSSEIWAADAAIIVSSLSDLDHDGTWWRQEYARYLKDQTYESIVVEIVKELLGGIFVKEVES